MKRKLVLAEWHKAQRALESALVLSREGYRDDAISRAYYAIFHAAKTALQVKDVEANTHAAVRALFGLHLIKTKEIERAWSKSLATALDVRLSADYDAEATFTARETHKACRDARAFLGRIRAYLLEQSFTAAELRGRRPKHG
jgi:uncharacterized protein (UPF0332 family)